MRRPDLALSASEVRGLFTYDPETGDLKWREARGRMAAGSSAGHKSKTGLVVRVRDRNYPAHRIAWLHTTGEWPSFHITHKDGDTANNRWANLGMKRQPEPEGRYGAYITVLGQQHDLGKFKTKRDALEAYRIANYLFNEAI